MPIIDAQIHVWGSGLPSNLAHRQVTAFPTEEAVGLMDEGGVDATVIHGPAVRRRVRDPDIARQYRRLLALYISSNMLLEQNRIWSWQELEGTL